MIITLHHLEKSRSFRIAWMLEELGLDYQIVRYARHPQTMLAPPELAKIHPLGKSPVVTVETGEEKLVLVESGAIIDYFARRYTTPQAGSLQPALDSKAYLRYTFWLHFAEGSAMPMLLLKLIFDKVEQGPRLVRPILKQVSNKVLGTLVLPTLHKQLAYIESELEHNEWLAGPEFSAADIQMGYVFDGAASRLGLADYPAIRRYLERAKQRPAYKAALQKVWE